jgi:hypothetical protein
VTAANSDVTVDIIRHPRGWYVVALTVPLAGQMTFEVHLMLNTGRPQSAISLGTLRLLRAVGFIAQDAGPRFVIRDARLGNVRVADIPMRLSAGPRLLDVEGMLGLDFLEQYAHARIDFRARRLTLVPD